MEHNILICKIEMGKGQKCGCDISLYIQPFAATKEAFDRYAKKEGDTYKEDKLSKRNY